MELYIYIDDVARRVEMFNDEKVSVTSSITNYTDIGKLFTDYSQTFTIPASNVNNSIFSHWYESAIEGGFDARVRYDGYIELDTIPFRKGSLKLTKANQKNGYIESYSVTFYGTLTQITDKFKDDKLNVLDYSSLDHTFGGLEVYYRISNTFGPSIVRYPLVGNNRRYEYGTGTANDITTATGAINWQHLFPAIPIKKILEFIQTKYGITFTGSFLNYKQFENLFLYMKNSEIPSIVSSKGITLMPTAKTTATTTNFTNFNLATGILFLKFSAGIDTTLYFNYYNRYTCEVVAGGVGPADVYNIEVYKNNVLFSVKQNCIGAQSLNFINISRSNAFQSYPNINDLYTFKITHSTINNFTYTIREVRYWQDAFAITYASTNSNATRTINQFSAPQTNFVKFAPDMKIADFITGLVKMFNLIITPINETTFELEPLDLYYQSGKITDLTEYIYSDEVEINAPTLNKSLSFEYEKSSNILNTKFKELFNREYGDLIYNDPLIPDGGSYKVKLPFENPMWERSTNSNFITTNFLDKDNKPYIPKPVLMYLRNSNSSSVQTVSPAIQSNIPSTTISQYIRFQNENNIIGGDVNSIQSLNFGVEISPWYLDNVINGVYNRVYQQYISNLYNIKTRVLKVKARLSKYQIANLKLKDRILIRDKRYLINNMTFDLTTNESSFELITDYRPLSTNSIGYRYSNAENVFLDSPDAVTFQLDLYLGVYDYISITSQTSGWVQWTESGYFYGDKSVEITIAQNTTGVDRNDIFFCKFAYTNGTDDTYVVYINQKG